MALRSMGISVEQACSPPEGLITARLGKSDLDGAGVTLGSVLLYPERGYSLWKQLVWDHRHQALSLTVSDFTDRGESGCDLYVTLSWLTCSLGLSPPHSSLTTLTASDPVSPPLLQEP